jgi:hypothetical protein
VLAFEYEFEPTIVGSAVIPEQYGSTSVVYDNHVYVAVVVVVCHGGTSTDVLL